MNADISPEAPIEFRAHELAAGHRLGTAPPDPVAAWAHVKAVQRWLSDVRQACVDPPPEASKAAEWLLDNDYQVHRALRQIRNDLPKTFYDQLPGLAKEGEEEQTGPPRIYAIALEYVLASHLQISLAGAVRFVQAYQQHLPLTIAELWAFPTMLRIACVEILVVALTPLLGGSITLPSALADASHDIHSLDPSERTARSISILGIVATIPWEDFFDQVSLVEAALGRDPSADYPQMDFETRDAYRAAVEEIARASRSDECEVCLLYTSPSPRD